MSESGALTIGADVVGSVNAASWENAVPLLRSLEIRNGTDAALNDLRIEFEAVPGFARKKLWVLDRMPSGESVAIRDRDLQLDPQYLNGLNEAERSLVRFQALRRDELLAEFCQEVRILARDEWGGMSSMGELLPAFVMPNDPAVARILKQAGEVLADNGHSSALDGYQSRDPRRTYLLVAAAWSAVAAESLTYAVPPPSFEHVGQKIRRPATVLGEGLATCLDSTLLFAAVIEAMGLHPLIVMQAGHCFVGAWLVSKTLRQLVEPDCGEIRKALALRELITFETTLVMGRKPATFEEAVARAARSLRESVEDEFVAAIDVARARMGQIKPLASHGSESDAAEPVAQVSRPLPLPPVPAFDDLPPEQAREERPLSPASRIDRWQRKLLDLSLRNRLLNFQLNQQSIPIVCPDIHQLEDQLSQGSKLRLISLPDENRLGGRDPELHRQKTQQDLNLEFARRALSNKELCCNLSRKELDNRLTTLYRSVRNDLSEGGSNTLFLAIGFLRWKQKPDDARFYRAPLLLIPVTLLRQSAVSPFRLTLHEDEARFNATLIQLLKKDFGRDLSAFENDLPQDECGVDVPLLLERVRRAIHDVPGFEVIEDAVLAKFSFAKYLMWKDLVDRIDQLKQNRVVRHLIENPDKPFASGVAGEMPRPHQIDVRYQPADLCHPLPADSTQLAAMMAASEGHDFVLIGPPGTGKSQTIANMITQCLASGRTVLFVAEKTAALDVVHRRLEAEGLGDCCLELHSNRAERKKFLSQLQESWLNRRRPKSNEWVKVNKELAVRRDTLNAYVAGLHARHANGWSPFDAMATLVRYRESDAPHLAWGESIQHDAAAYQKKRDTIANLAATAEALNDVASLPMVDVAEWSATWESRLLTQCNALKSAASTFQTALGAFAAQLGLTETDDCSLPDLELFRRLAQAIPACRSQDVPLVVHKQLAALPGALVELRRATRTFREAAAKSNAVFDVESLPGMPVDELDQQWRQAVSSLWPMSWFAKRRVRRLLQGYAQQGIANPEVDLKLLRSMQQQLAALSTNLLRGLSQYWKGLETNAEELWSVVKSAHELRQSIIQLGRPGNLTEQISRTVLAAIKQEPMRQRLIQSADAFLAAMTAFCEEAQRYAGIAGRFPFEQSSNTIADDAIEAVSVVQSRRTALKRWTAWCEARNQARAEGLEEFLKGVESGALDRTRLFETFDVAYARWWLPMAIDRTPALRQFQRFRHENTVREFCDLDRRARELAAARARKVIEHDLPAPDEVARKSELGVLRHQMSLKRPSKSIRDVITAMPAAFSKLAPCVMMSPLSIAQYLPPNHPPFDVVIFDEASQITTWDAIGAIARGRQTIIVGDPKQLPPTNFFGKSDDDSDDDSIEDFEKDLESILDEASASGLPTLNLQWHYRSRHESLIAFSNERYYRSLVTFPSAASENLGVTLRHVPDGRYDRGKSRTNLVEAQAIVEDAVARMRACLDRPESERLTFGVVTFNSQQQTLLQDLFDQAVRDLPELEWYFSDDRIEPTVVKNLENVQGDERDVMYFSITFSPNAHGQLPLTFGALNRDGGERRLNVAITRARQQLIVYSSFLPDQLKAERSGKRGILDLKAFLEYAEKGPNALIAGTAMSVGDHESPFEEAVAEALAARGWQVVPQIGVSAFRVDLGIVHPDRPGAFLAGIECDGATYHRAATARDRDKTRQQILESLGWKILRVWSTDWWYDSHAALEQIHKRLEQFLCDSRQTNAHLNEQEERINPGIAPHGVEIESKQPSMESTLEQEASGDSFEQRIRYDRRPLSDARLVAFLRAIRNDTGVYAVELVNKHLDQGQDLDSVFSTDDESGYFLSVERLSNETLDITFGYQADGTAGDGGVWRVTFQGDVVASVEQCNQWIS